MRLVARPIDQWPGEHTARREGSPFTATWSDTVALLGREVEHLAGREAEAVIQVAITERECRLDGWIRADARPQHPGVILSFESKHGPLRYATDRFENRGWRGYLPGWQSNVRAIALGLEALRPVDRYGIAQAGEQYRGWNALPPGTPMPAAMTAEEAARFVARNAWPGEPADLQENWLHRLISEPDMLTRAYRAAAGRLHPDKGGDPAEFRRLQEARELLERSRG